MRVIAAPGDAKLYLLHAIGDKQLNSSFARLMADY